MADSKKFNGSTWEHSLRKLTTDTDTITTLPVDIYADGNNATVGISGNTVQNGTPTPDSPITPEGTGDKTANLLYKCIENASISSSGKIVENSSFKIYLAKIKQGETYSLVNNYFAFYTSEPNYDLVSYRGERYVDSIFTAPIDGYVAVRYRTEDTNTMLNSGSTALPYEPYGYKIPISSVSTTTPVYLGEVQTTRKIKKYEMTGNENIQTITDSISETGTKVYGYRYDALGMTDIIDYYGIVTVNNYPVFVCSHFKEKTEGYDSFKSIKNGEIGANSTGGGSNLFLIFATNQYTTGETFKAYLQAQYANGTPVTLWYVLSSATTGIVNEPLMKIGDYADEVSGITVPTITGADSFDVETTLKPSEVELTYTGWHDATVQEWDGSEWNE